MTISQPLPDMMGDIQQKTSDNEGIETIDARVIEGLRELQIEGRPDVLSELIDIFIENAEQSIESIRDAIKAGDAVEIRQRSHALKGSSANLGANRLLDVSRRIGEKGRAGSLEGIESLLSELICEFDRARTALENEKAPIAKP